MALLLLAEQGECYDSLWNETQRMLNSVQYSWPPMTRTSRQLKPKPPISPGFPSYIYCYFTRGNSNLPLTRSTKHSVTPIFFKATVSILYVIPVQIQCPSLYTNQALLVNSFSRISIYISCCPWREVRMLLAFPLHPFAYFLTLAYLPRTPDNSNFFDFPRRFELSRVDCNCFITHSRKFFSSWKAYLLEGFVQNFDIPFLGMVSREMFFFFKDSSP